MPESLSDLANGPEEPSQQGGPPGERLRLLEAEVVRYRTLFETAPDPYLVTGPEGALYAANGAARRLLGPALPAPGQSLAVLLDIGERDAFAARLAAWRQQPRQTLRWRLPPPSSAALQPAALAAAEGWSALLLWRLRGPGDPVELNHTARNVLQRGHAALDRLRQRVQDHPEVLDLLARAERTQDELASLLLEALNRIP